MDLDLDPDELEKAYTTLKSIAKLVNPDGNGPISKLPHTDDLQKDFNTWSDDGSGWIVSAHRDLHTHISQWVAQTAQVSTGLAALMRASIDAVNKAEGGNKKSLDQGAAQIDTPSPSKAPAPSKTPTTVRTAS